MTPSATNLSTSPPRGGATATPPPRWHQPRDADALTANLVVGILGIAAFAVSFTHVVQTSIRAGQTGWVAFAIAVSVELMALGSVSEIRRRRRYRQPDRWPRCVLALGIVMSLAANLAVAQSTPWGYVMAAWPSLAFGAAAGIIESRPASPSNAAPEPPTRTPRTKTRSPAPRKPKPPSPSRTSTPSRLSRRTTPNRSSPKPTPNLPAQKPNPRTVRPSRTNPMISRPRRTGPAGRAS